MPRSSSSAATRPVYLRLRDEIAAAIIAGRYKEGELLPSVRAFAAERGANPLTVAKAYQRFQEDHVVEVLRGIGICVMSGAAERLRLAERAQFLEQEWPAISERIRLLGIDLQELFDLAE